LGGDKKEKDEQSRISRASILPDRTSKENVQGSGEAVMSVITNFLAREQKVTLVD